MTQAIKHDSEVLPKVLSGRAQHSHSVQFYEDDAFLVERVSRFIAGALGADESTLVVATPEHRKKIEKALEARSIDLTRARGRKRYLSLDAAETLAEFMAGDMPDVDRFKKAAGKLIAEMGGGPLKAFGEMVAMLCERGNFEAAIRLEELWNELAASHPLTLLCTYPMASFAGGQRQKYFERVCEQHTDVLPSEDYTLLPEGGERFRAVAVLQQKARSLESEVAARKETERAHFLLAAIVDSSEDAIISKTLEGVIASWNQGAERIFGYQAAEVIGRSVTVLIPKERLHEEVEILGKLRRGERIEHYETVRIAKDGRKVDVSLTVSPVRDGQGELIGASKIARDISERVRAERMLREADKRKDEFLATLAHELRNPLAPIASSLEILRLGPVDGTGNARVHEVMDRQVKHLVRLVDDLLEVSRITSGKISLRRESTDLAAILRSAIDTSLPMIEKSRHQLTVALPQERIVLQGDGVRLTQVFINLLNNAAKYTEDNGEIAIGARREGKEVIVSIRDTGLGIPAEMLPRVFDMFAQVDRTLSRAQGGLGIGLALAQKIVELHGGRIEARSQGLGQGSEFLVYLPVTRAEAWVAAPAGGKGAKEPGKRHRILIVDDNRDAAHSLDVLLRMLKHETKLAYNGVEALVAAEEFRPDIVLMDIGMPEMDGCEAARRLRQTDWGRGATLVALTGWGQSEDRRQSAESGFDHHFTKPLSIEALLALLGDSDENLKSRK